MENLEIWRAVVGYEGLYEVSSWGRVRSLDKYVNGRYSNKRYVQGMILKFQPTHNGYLTVGLYKDIKLKRFRVHRLVAQAFLPNPDNLPEVNHINYDITDNRVENLEWCTREYNVRYSKAKTVYMLTLDGGLCGLWPSTQECNKYGFKQSLVARCCRGETTQYKGFRWSYTSPKPLLKLPYYIIN